MAEYKHENKFKLKPRAKLLFSANRVPDRTEEDDAFYNRWLTVTFPESIPSEEQDKELTEKLTGLADTEEREESQKHEGKLEGVLAWSLIGLKRLETQGEFTGDLDPLATKELWKEWGNSVERFISRYCIKKNQVNEERAEEEEFKVHVSTLYDLYQQYARFQGMKTESKKGFTMKLKKETGVRHARPSINGEQQRGFFGLKLKEDAAKKIEEGK
ncbi:hypothetical protein GLU64_01675 [Nanohaloarchaea archaeon]|nr:hypothetical protein [Candidatus Nanohaloarchaea archaeon]